MSIVEQPSDRPQLETPLLRLTDGVIRIHRHTQYSSHSVILPLPATGAYRHGVSISHLLWRPGRHPCPFEIRLSLPGLWKLACP